jgi:HK97 family phage prohead protease
VELRKSEDGKETRMFSGYAAKFNSPSQVLGYGDYRFIETIKPGAFKRSLGDKSIDVIWNIEHRDFYILGRKSAGTVKIFEDGVGLRVEGEIPETSYGNDLLVSMRRGDISYMSFAFEQIKHSVDRSKTPVVRTLEEVNLYDVAVVINPAYMSTEASVRSMCDISFMKDLEQDTKDIAFRDYMNTTLTLIESEIQ